MRNIRFISFLSANFRRCSNSPSLSEPILTPLLWKKSIYFRVRRNLLWQFWAEFRPKKSKSWLKLDFWNDLDLGIVELVVRGFSKIFRLVHFEISCLLTIYKNFFNVFLFLIFNYIFTLVMIVFIDVTLHIKSSDFKGILNINVLWCIPC